MLHLQGRHLRQLVTVKWFLLAAAEHQADYLVLRQMHTKISEKQQQYNNGLIIEPELPLQDRDRLVQMMLWIKNYQKILLALLTPVTNEYQKKDKESKWQRIYKEVKVVLAITSWIAAAFQPKAAHSSVWLKVM